MITGFAKRRKGLHGIGRAYWILAAVLSLPAGCTQSEQNAPAIRPAENVQVVEEYWPDGKPRLRKQVRPNADGTLVDHGTCTQWHPNGQKQYEATYIDGQLDGIETSWHQNGQKWTEQHYVRGKRHGVRHSWDENGRMNSEEFYVDDKPDGTWTVWDSSGRVKWQGSFDRGTPLP